MRTLARRLAYPLVLAGVRLRHRAGRTALLAAGVACAAALLSGVLGGGVVAQEEAAARAVQRVPAADRALVAVYADLGVPRGGVELTDVDRAANRAVTGLVAGRPGRVLQLKLLTLGGRPVNLAGADDLRRWVRLASGRYPTACTPQRCEVLHLGGSDAVPTAPGLALTVVGEGRMRSSALFGRLPGAEGARVGESFEAAEPPPFVVAEGFDELARLPSLSSLYRTYGWVGPLPPGSVASWRVDDFLRDFSRARAGLRTLSPYADLVGPVDALAGARDEGQVGARRLLLLGGQAAALLLAFAVLAAAGSRRDAEAASRRLTWFGARRWQVGLVFAVEGLAATLLGGLLGWGAGSALTLLVADRAGVSPGDVVAHSTLSLTGIGAAAVLIAAAALVYVLGLYAPAATLGGRAVTPLDVVGIGALLVLAVTLLRGEAGAESVSSGRTGVLLLLLPGLVVLVAAAVCVRLLPPALRLLEQAAPRRWVAARLAVLSLARRPGSAALAVACLAAALGLAGFAALYRATLELGIRDQAGYALPYELSVREDLSPSGLVSPLEAAPLERYRGLGDDATGVLRQRGSVATLGGPSSFTLLGVPSEQLGRIQGWRTDFAREPLEELVDRLASPGAGLRAVPLPPRADALAVEASAEGGNAALEAAVETPRGTYAFLDLGSTRGPQTRMLAARIPERARGGRVVALSLSRAATVEGHGSDFNRVDGTVSLEPLTALTSGRAQPLVTGYEDWIGTDNVDAKPFAGGVRLRFLSGNSNLAGRFRLQQPGEGEPVPVLATPALAAAGAADGLLPLRLPGAPLRVRVVGVVERFPGTEGEAVVADGPRVATALNAVRPGAAVPNEVWIAAGDKKAAAAASALSRPPFDVLAVRSRAALERELREDPFAAATLWTLAASAAAALLLGLAGLGLLVAGDRRDDDGDLFDLEAEGASPAALRRHLRLRVGFVAGLGLFSGAALAASLAALVVAVVALTAGATGAEPPLVLAAGWEVAAFAAAFALTAFGGVWLGTARGLRGRA